MTWLFVPKTRAQASPGGGDPYFSSVILLMQAVNDDLSNFNHTATAQGNAATDTSDFFYAPSSCSYPDTTSRTSIVESLDLRLNTSDFICEIIGKPLSTNTALGAFYVKGTNTPGGIIFAMCTGSLTFRANGTNDLVHSTTISSSAYSYAAFIGEGGTTRRIYYASTPGGTATQVATSSQSYNNNEATDAAVGNGGLGVFFWTGRLNIRITKGTTRGITGGTSYTSPTSFPTS